MKLLFLGYHYPGPLSPMARWLAERGHEILFASNRAPSLQKPVLDGIQRVILKRFPAAAKKETRLDILENGLRTARYAEKSFLAIKESGFNPEIIITASSGGAALALSSVFPNVYWVNFIEPAFFQENSVTGKLVQFLQICQAQSNYVFFYSQQKYFPEILRPGIRIFNPGVNSKWYRPTGSKREPNLAVFFNLRNPEKLLVPYLEASSKNRAVWFTGSAQANKLFSSSFPYFEPARLQTQVANGPEETRQIFSTASFSFFEFPGEMMFQSMSCECPSFASANIEKEDLPDGMIQLQPSDNAISAILDDPCFLEEYGKNCRKLILKHYDMAKILPEWFMDTCHNAEIWKKRKPC